MPRAECGLIRGECGDSLSCLGREFDPLPLGLRTSVTFREESHSLLACRSPGAVRGTVSGHRAGARGRFRGRIRAPAGVGGRIAAAGLFPIADPLGHRAVADAPPGRRVFTSRQRSAVFEGRESGVETIKGWFLRALFLAGLSLSGRRSGPPGPAPKHGGMRACARVKYPRRRLRNGATRARDSIKKCSINQMLTAFMAL